MNKKRIALIAAIAIVVPNFSTIINSIANAAAGTVTGTVFNDKNANGTNDGSDVGVSGTVVQAYDSAGTNVGTATTDNTGAYSISVTGASTSAVRIEFTTPDGFQPSFAGAGSNTSIQFVTLPATNVNYSVLIPGNYCDDNLVSPLAVSTCIRPGPATGIATAKNTLTFTKWSTKPTATQMLTHSQTGATWGIAQDPATGLVWNSAVLRRHSGLGPKGLGGLYVTTTKGGSIVASFDIGTLQDQNGNPILLSANDANYTDAARGLSNTTALSIDLAGYEGVGQVGLGDIDITPDGYLWVTNLYEKTILRIRLGGTATAPTLGAVTEYTVPQLSATTCNVGGTITNNIAHPWALEYDKVTGHMLVGIVCGRESNAVAYSSPMQTGTGGSAAAIGGAAIIDLDPAGSGTWTRTTSILINKPRWIEGCNDTAQISTNDCLIMKWKGWSNDFTSIYALSSAIGGNYTTLPRYPQPILSDIETLSDGSFVAGFLDRFSMQMGADNIMPTETSVVLPWTGSLMSGNVAGDLQLMCKTGASTWTQEESTASGVVPQAGGCVGITTVGGQTHQSAGRPFTGTFDYGFGPVLLIPTDRQPDNNGYLEFFNDTVCDNTHPLNGTFTASSSCYTSALNNHMEITQGGLAVWPPTGAQELASTTMDPDNQFNAGGVRWFDTANGDASWGRIYTKLSGSENATNSFMKSSSMGDLELVCNAAPVQIGNRVWIDSNNDGIQDPGEAPVVGATIRLYNSTGLTLLGTAITNANGEYYFSSNVTEVAAGNGDNSGGGVTLGVGFIIRMNNAADFTGSGPLAGYNLTTATALSSATAFDTSVDSNATLVSGYPELTVASLSTGISNHTYDIGFVQALVTTTTAAPTTTIAVTTTTVASTTTTAAPSSTVVPSASSTTVAPSASTLAPTTTARPIVVGMGNYTWIDADADGVQDVGEPVLSGVKVTLYNADGTPAKNVAGGPATAITDAKGYYFIDNLYPGTYFAKFTLPGGYSFTTQSSSGSTSANDSNPDAVTGATPPFSITASVSGDTVVDSDPNTLASFVNPTIDAGVIIPVAVGNVVWVDSDKDGVQDPTERPIEGVVVVLYNPDGTPAKNLAGAPAVATTDVNGKYLIDNLRPGNYYAQFLLPTGLSLTAQSSSTSTRANDSNPDPATGKTPVFSVTAAVSGNTVADTNPNTVARFVNPTIDAGITPLPSVEVGNYVWRDINGDGLQGPADHGVKGAVLTLVNMDGTSVTNVYGNPVRPQTTGKDGKYLFTDLPPGQYKVLIAYPKGFIPTTPNRPNRGLNSSNFTATSKVLAAGERDITLDFGMVYRPKGVLPATK